MLSMAGILGLDIAVDLANHHGGPQTFVVSRDAQRNLGSPCSIRYGRVVEDTAPLYDDGAIICDDDGISIRWYYLWGHKKISYAEIRSAMTFPLRPLRGKWRIWGSGDLMHWYNLDIRRSGKALGIELDIGGRVRPCITPDDTDAVIRIITEHSAIDPNAG